MSTIRKSLAFISILFCLISTSAFAEDYQDFSLTLPDQSQLKNRTPLPTDPHKLKMVQYIFSIPKPKLLLLAYAVSPPKDVATFSSDDQKDFMLGLIKGIYHAAKAKEPKNLQTAINPVNIAGRDFLTYNINLPEHNLLIYSIVAHNKIFVFSFTPVSGKTDKTEMNLTQNILKSFAAK